MFCNFEFSNLIQLNSMQHQQKNFQTFNRKTYLNLSQDVTRFVSTRFQLGVSVTKKSLKLYTDFYSSDIIIASPLGLRMVLETDSDFLSSIEVLIMDQVNIFYHFALVNLFFTFQKPNCLNGRNKIIL